MPSEALVAPDSPCGQTVVALHLERFANGRAGIARTYGLFEYDRVYQGVAGRSVVDPCRTHAREDGGTLSHRGACVSVDERLVGLDLDPDDGPNVGGFGRCGGDCRCDVPGDLTGVGRDD